MTGLSRSLICRDGFQLQIERGKLTGVLFCSERQRNVRKCKTHVQKHCFRSLNLLFCVVLAASTVVFISPHCFCFPPLKKEANVFIYTVAHFPSRLPENRNLGCYLQLPILPCSLGFELLFDNVNWPLRKIP